ncbi:MAG: PilZ domain-containing protein [Bacillota bacterium]
MDRRKYPRFQTNLQAVASLKNRASVVQIELVNIGGGGICFQCEEELTEGENLHVYFPFITVHCYVIWRQDNRYGAMFINPLGDELQVICSGGK